MSFLKSAAMAACLGLTAVAGVIGSVAAQTPQGPADVTAARLANADKEPGQWMSYGRTYDEQRFSPLTQINDKTVGRLGLAWYADLQSERGMESTPLFIDGVLYDVEPWNVTHAYDARTGKLLWTYDPHVDRKAGAFACCDIDARGIAAWRGKLYIAALDGRLIAIDAKTGKEVWSTQTLPPNQPYSVTGAPRVFDGKVVIGNGGGEAGVRGYITAYDAETGKQAWRFWITPGDPNKPFEAPELKWAAKTWTGEWWKYGGGGNAWDTMVYDPKLKLMYVGTGNAGPWAQQYRSPNGGDNLFTASIVALHIEDGSYAWHFQEVPGDEWDYDATESLILADLKIDGKLRHTIIQAPKNGFFYVLDRATGKFISAKNFVPITWASGLDPKTGRAQVKPEARYSDKPVLITPSSAGGHNWNPMAFSPQTNFAYFPAFEGYMVFTVDPKYKYSVGMHNLGVSVTGPGEERKKLQAYADSHTKAYLLAWDVIQQKEAWRVPYSRRGSGGVLATAGNLVFEGTIGETFVAYRADTGEKVWEMPVQQVAVAAPISYELDGVQYIAVNAGWGGGIAHGPAANDSSLNLSIPRLLVFKLDGKAQLPYLAPKTATLSPPPPVTGTPEQIAHGAALYAKTCSACHGEAVKGGVKDLRRLTPETHAQFLDIVLGGIRADKGMVSFASVLSKQDAEDIHQYIIKRAHEDFADMQAGK